jgi:hypothetical protein
MTKYFVKHAFTVYIIFQLLSPFLSATIITPPYHYLFHRSLHPYQLLIGKFVKFFFFFLSLRKVIHYYEKQAFFYALSISIVIYYKKFLEKFLSFVKYILIYSYIILLYYTRRMCMHVCLVYIRTLDIF